MTLAIHGKWHWLPAGPPGHRFRNHYYANQRTRRRGRLAAMILRFCLSGLAGIVGFVLVFLPGPAIVFFIIAGALLAADWLPVARLLDWGEVQARWQWHRGRRLWGRLPWRARVLVGVAAAATAAVAGYGFYLGLR